MIDPEDRVLIIGTSSKPYDTEKPKDKTNFRDFFAKILYTPLPNYPSRNMLWVAMLEKLGVHRPDPDEIQTLARISQYYSSGAICQVVRRTLTARRVERLARKPFQVNELIGPLAKDEPLAVDVDKALRDWYQETVPSVAAAKGESAPPAKEKGGGKKKK